MVLPLLLSLVFSLGGRVPLSAPLPAGPFPCPSVDKKLNAAVEKLRRAIGADAELEKREALAELVALGDGGAAPVLQAEYAAASQGLRKLRDSVVLVSYSLQRKEESLGLMELRLERDSSLADSVRNLRKEIADLRAKRERDRGRVRRTEAWCDDLGEATKELFSALGAGARRKAEGAIWKDAEDSEDLEVRMGAVEMLGRVGGRGTSVRLQGMLKKIHGERRQLQRKLPKMEKEVHEFERRLQEEAARQGGGMSRASMQQYNRVKAEAAAGRRAVTRMAHLLDALAEAAGHALDREEGKDLEKALASILRVRKKAKNGLDLFILDVFDHARNPLVGTALRSMLAEDEDPLTRAAIIDGLARRGDLAIEDALLETYLRDESWHVRSRSAAALATLRSRAAIPVLIERLDREEGRLRTDVAGALASLTAKPFGTNAPAWRRWWQAEGGGFEVPPAESELEGSLDAEEALGVTFFGIKTESQRVLFLFDVSGSMTFSMVPRNNPSDEPGRPYDMPRPGEDSRLDAAKRELVKALGGIRDGGLFNIVLYASDVWSWEDELVEMETEARSDALRFVESLTAVGGTNIYGALAHAFNLAGVKDEGHWSEPLVDTMFILSDGRASVGVTTNADDILTFVRDRNRAAGIVIHTIGLSGAQDAYLLRSLAEENGGTYAAR